MDWLMEPSGLLLLLALLLSLAVVAALGQLAIPLLRRLKVGQRVRDDGPQSHLKKMGTPTMGGLFFALPGLLLCLLWAPESLAVRALVLMALAFGAVGFVDDYLKVVKRQPLGLRARHKLAVQTPAALLLAYWAMSRLGLSTMVTVPFGWAQVQLGWLYPPFVALLAIFAGNAVNITDGADGLLAGAIVPSLGAYILIARAMSQPSLAWVGASLIGACLGFLIYNRYPAKVIMGDTGSLALGGALTAMAVLTKTELLLVLVGLLYVLEAGSVIVQVISFQTTGRRVFRMSPVHHHFELLGWPETRVVALAWIVSCAGALLGLLALSGMAG